MPKPFKSKQYFFQSTPRKNSKPLNCHLIFEEAYRLDRLSCEGINYLLPFVATLSSIEFEMIVNRLLKECFYVNRTFSDAVNFLSIWLKKSPHTLIESLRQEDLKKCFYKTEYDKDGHEWPFSRLLHTFLPVIEKADVSPNLIMDYLFNTFDFLGMPKLFIWLVIGYDQLELRLKEIPKPFHEPLLEKMTYLYHRGNDLGPRSHRLLLFYRSEGEALQQQVDNKIASYPKLG